MFDEADQDQDGYLSIQELHDLLESVGEPHSNDIVNMLVHSVSEEEEAEVRVPRQSFLEMMTNLIN